MNQDNEQPDQNPPSGLDVMRLAGTEHPNAAIIKECLGNAYDTVIRRTPPGYELSQALLRLEEACMWAVKGATR